MEWGTIIGLAVALIVLALIALDSFFIVEQSEVKLVERLGKFHRKAEAGLHFKFPVGIDYVTPAISLRLQQIDIPVESKTKDDVSVVVAVSLQFRVTDAQKSWYALDDEKCQFEAFVRDAVRGVVPSQTLDLTFENGSDLIAKRVSEYLTKRMTEYGYHLDTALVTAVTPNANVLAAMNEINAQQRLKNAAKEKADGEYIAHVRRAEGEAKSKELQGQGIAAQRKAIVDGLAKSVEQLKGVSEGINAHEVLATILATQHYDTLKELGGANAKVVFVPYSAGSVSGLSAELLQMLTSAKES